MSETKEKIIRTARQLFHEQGYEATGIATILREANVKSGSLYHFFPSKEKLLVAVLEEYLQDLYPELVAPVERENSDPLAKIFALLDHYRSALLQTDFFFGCPIGNLALEVGTAPGPVSELIAANFSQWREVVDGWLAEAFAVDKDAPDIKGLGTLTLTVMEGAVMQSRAARSIEPFDESVEHLRQYLNLLISRNDF